MATVQLNVTGEQLNIGAQQLNNRQFTDVMKTVYPSNTTASEIPTVDWINDELESKSEVEFNRIVSQGTKIGTITIDGTTTDIYAPSGGGGSSIVTWYQEQTGGTEIATITIDDYTTRVYVPTGVTGVKGDDETSYRTGNVNITPANIGAYEKPASGIPSTDLSSAVQTSLGLADTALQTHQDISGLLPKSGGTMTGRLIANETATATLSTSQTRNIYAGTTDIGTGASLVTGSIYLVYE